MGIGTVSIRESFNRMQPIQISSRIEELLNSAQSRLQAEPGGAGSAIASLAAELRREKREQSPVSWEQTVGQCRAHPLRELLHQDPLTERAFSKPHGYQGDAELLDMIYARDWRGIYPRPVSQLGQHIFDYTITCKAPSAVRIRRDRLSRMIDELCERVSAPHILSVGCGHLREAGQSAAVRARRIGRFVGLDQAPAAIAMVERELGSFGVQAVQGSIRLVLGGPLAQEKFDFIYSAGLYDYLEDRLAQRLTERLFDMLKPGGRLLIANYLPDIDDVGYMETYMDWRLIYRDAAAMHRLAAGISESMVLNQRSYNDPSDNIVFLQLERH